MRYILISVSAMMFLFLACTKPVAEKENIEYSTVRVNTAAIYADGIDELQLSATDAANNDISTQGIFYINETALQGRIFTTQTPGSYKIRFESSGAKTKPVTIQAVSHNQQLFSKKIILEEFAGAWCGYCPRINRLIDSLTQSNPSSIIPVSIHNGDGMQFRQEAVLRENYNINSFPAVFLNRAREWDESGESVQSELARKAKCGLALNSFINGTTISGTVQVKFGISTSLPLQLVVLLLEDNLVSSQVNLFNNSPESPFYNAGNPIHNYRHQHVLREAGAGGIFGQRIPGSSQQKGGQFEQNFTFNVPSGFNLSNGKIVAFVQYAENSVTRFGILNAQVARAGFSAGFD